MLALREAALLALMVIRTAACRSAVSQRGGDAERYRLAARIHNRLVYEWWFIRSPIWVVWAILRGARFANAAGSKRERAQALSTAAVISGTAPVLAPIALRLVNRSLRLRENAGEGWGIAQSHHFRGFVLYTASRYAEAIEAFDTAIDAFDIVGDRWEQVAAMWQKALCLGRLGQLHDAGSLARDTYWEPSAGVTGLERVPRWRSGCATCRPNRGASGVASNRESIGREFVLGQRGRYTSARWSTLTTSTMSWSSSMR